MIREVKVKEGGIHCSKKPGYAGGSVRFSLERQTTLSQNIGHQDQVNKSLKAISLTIIQFFSSNVLFQPRFITTL